MNARQAHFALLMGTTNLSRKQAGIDSGYSAKTAQTAASRLLQNVEVQAAIKRHKENIAAKAEWKKADAIKRLQEISLQDKPDRTTAISIAAKMLPGWNEPEKVEDVNDSKLVDLLAELMGIAE